VKQQINYEGSFGSEISSSDIVAKFSGSHSNDLKDARNYCHLYIIFLFPYYTVGSELDHKIKQAAAQGETAWEGMGQQPEVRVWRIEKFKVALWPKEQHGEFFRGDSYIGK
jgi:hypothetical protein